MSQYKIGDEVLLIKSRNGTSQYEGQVLKVTLVQPNGNLTVRTTNGTSITLFTYRPADEFCLATKEAQIDYYKGRIEDLSKQIYAFQVELDILEKYESREHYVADKIDQLLKADTVDAKAEVLRVMKNTNYL